MSRAVFAADRPALPIPDLLTADARSRIQDADFAAETANLSKAQVLQQAGVAMLAQANNSASRALELLR